MWTSSWDRLGDLPAVPVVIVTLALQAVIGLTLALPVSAVLGLLVVSAFIAYCVARPTQGSGIFWAGTVPQYGSIILHDITGLTDWWLYAALIPLAALWAAQEEREAYDKCTAAHDPGRATSVAPQ